MALANKECLVSAGDLFLAEIARAGATLLPVDSEHNAIFQVLDPAQRNAVVRQHAHVVLQMLAEFGNLWVFEEWT